MNKLFVYGTLLDSPIQKMIFGREIKVEKDILPNYLMGSLYGYKAITPKKGESVDGGVLEITDAELESADTYETDLYKRVSVNTEKNKKVFVYEKNVV